MKFFALFLSILLTFSVASCSSSDSNDSNEKFSLTGQAYTFFYDPLVKYYATKTPDSNGNYYALGFKEGNTFYIASYKAKPGATLAEIGGTFTNLYAGTYTVDSSNPKKYTLNRTHINQNGTAVEAKLDGWKSFTITSNNTFILVL